MQQLDSANILSLASDSATDCRIHCIQPPNCIVITNTKPAIQSAEMFSTHRTGVENIRTTATRPTVIAANHFQETCEKHKRNQQNAFYKLWQPSTLPIEHEGPYLTG
ncbi:hypothetical protein L798_05552 [Zootermopsis nevadensis]|uniref:Uncharacterized protein n=1 Tax=Zootermopsis nevadensis TaxID=136037 RepID=A0A067RBK9_ZOONE|nr:hypothetical protein L798_05552 [Zootermopsis nevadensis]